MCTAEKTYHTYRHMFQNNSCIGKPQVMSGRAGEGVRTPCTLPLDPPLSGTFQGCFSVLSDRTLQQHQETLHCSLVDADDK